jgi:hypothetical protein
MAHVDNVANQFLQYAQLPEQAQRWTAAYPVTMYIEAVDNDALYHLTTGAHDDNETWYRSFLAYVSDEDVSEPAVILATIIQQNHSNSEVSHNAIVHAVERALLTNRRQRRPTRTVCHTALDIVGFVEPAQTDDQDRYLGYQPDHTITQPMEITE